MDAPVRPRIFVSRTREKLGCTCDQIGRTLEPCKWKETLFCQRKGAFFSLVFFIRLSYLLLQLLKCCQLKCDISIICLFNWKHNFTSTCPFWGRDVLDEDRASATVHLTRSRLILRAVKLTGSGEQLAVDKSHAVFLCLPVL